MNPLRNPNINYFRGWFFVTFQVAKNKSVFGVVSDKRLIHNALGEMVLGNLLKLGEIFQELYLDTAMVMPNHVHVVLKIDSRDANKDLTYFIGRFKSFTTNQYYKLLKADACVDIGRRLWADNFYDNLVSDYQELQNVRNYTLKNPERWEDDRFGPVTTHHVGNIELLSEGLVAFVASDTHDDWRAERPHLREVREWVSHGGETPTIKPHGGETPAIKPHGGETPAIKPHGGETPAIKSHGGETPTIKSHGGETPAIKSHGGETPTIKGGEVSGEGGATKVRLRELPLVSTFSSFEEQGALLRRLDEKLPFVWVAPAGIKAVLPQRIKAACEEGWGLVISPVATGTGLNKQRAIWCNRWVLKVAERIYVGTIKVGGTLDTLLKGRH